eukprot:TRINITY_DN12602_c0_g1_i1.p2 TRINITY_DN12602_c0_g1~~TRINITY_DN12602_c0_g1_i1.p2  ORF type:complete len:376 (+),score=60.03 TRINITY_DN12602_c0_g1_i1:700-1827(+)
MPRWRLAPALALAVLALSANKGLGANFEMHVLNSYPDAVCNDGSPATYYRDNRDIGTSDVVIYLEDADYCFDIGSCQKRCGNPQWKKYCTHRVGAQAKPAILSDDPKMNSAFYQWFKVFVPYCSNDRFSGNRSASPATGNLHFRGRAILEAVLTDLEKVENFATVKNIVLAGGDSSTVNCDFLSRRITKAKVRCILDADFLPYPRYIDAAVPNCPYVTRNFTSQREFWNGALPLGCSERAPAQDRDVVCAQTSTSWVYLDVPAFVTVAQWDGSAMVTLCADKNPDRPHYAQHWGLAMLQLANASVGARPDVHLWMPGCISQSQTFVASDPWYSKAKCGPNKVMLDDSLGDWLKNTGYRYIADNCGTVPCGAGCQQ